MVDFEIGIVLLKFFMKYLSVAHADRSIERYGALFLGTRFKGSLAFFRRQPGISLKNFTGAVLSDAP